MLFAAPVLATAQDQPRANGFQETARVTETTRTDTPSEGKQFESPPSPQQQQRQLSFSQHDATPRQSKQSKNDQLLHQRQLERQQHTIHAREMRERDLIEKEEYEHELHHGHGRNDQHHRHGQNRLEHLYQAAKHLEHAGLEELAEEVMEHAEELEHDLEGDDHEEKLLHMIHDMHRHLEELHREVLSLRRELSEKR